jgi:hypothetical protein
MAFRVVSIMRYEALVAIVAAVALSGCLAGGAPDLEAVSSGLIDDARAIVGEDAALYSIIGIEPSKTIPAEDTDGCGEIPKEPNPGDGKALTWIYLYGSQATESAVAIVTDAKGEIRCEMEESFRMLGTDPRPLDAWNVTSVQATRTIHDNVEDFQDRIKGADAQLILDQTPDGPVWTYAYFNLDAMVFGHWSVHAQTREFLGSEIDIRPIDSAEPFPMPESGRAEGTTIGTLALIIPEPAEFRINEEGHLRLELVITSDDPLAGLGQSYEIAVYDPFEERHAHIVTNGEVITFTDPQPGAWDVRAFPVAGGAYSFTVDWSAYSGPPVMVEESGYATQMPHGPSSWFN